MARLFDNASSEFLLVNTAAVTAYPFAMACAFNSDDNASIQTLMWCGDKDAATYFSSLYLRGDIGGDPLHAFSHNYGGASARYAESTSGYSTGVIQYAAGIWIDVDERYAYMNGGNKGSNASSVGAMANHDRTAIGGAMDSSPGYYMSGHIAEAGIWDLTNWGATDAERVSNFEKVITSLAKGYTPEHFPLGRVAYWSLIRSLNDYTGGLNLTASGTTVSSHPSIKRPTSVCVPFGTAGAPPVGLGIPVAVHHNKTMRVA